MSRFLLRRIYLQSAQRIRAQHSTAQHETDQAGRPLALASARQYNAGGLPAIWPVRPSPLARACPCAEPRRLSPIEQTLLSCLRTDRRLRASLQHTSAMAIGSCCQQIWPLEVPRGYLQRQPTSLTPTLTGRGRRSNVHRQPFAKETMDSVQMCPPTARAWASQPGPLPIPTHSQDDAPLVPGQHRSHPLFSRSPFPEPAATLRPSSVASCGPTGQAPDVLVLPRRSASAHSQALRTTTPREAPSTG